MINMNIKTMAGILLIFVTLKGNAQINPEKPGLSIGDPAPRLEVFKWLKGTPVEGFKKDKVYVMEFWATWCGPCIMAMPHLSKLAQQYRDKVTVIGVSVWENNRKPVPDAAAIQKFVDEQGNNMDYTVAMDDPGKNFVSESWLRAAGIRGIPATFVIGGDGKIAWIGHPLKLDSILKEIVERPEQFDLNRAKAAYRKDLQLQAKQEAIKSVMGYGMSRNYGMAWQQARKLMQEDPDFEKENFLIVAQAHFNYNSKAALAYVLEKAKDREFLKTAGEGKTALSTEKLLERIALMVGKQQGLDLNTYYFITGQLEKTVKRIPDNANVWSTLAHAYAALNNPSKAVFAQERAIVALQKDIPSNPHDESQKAYFKYTKERMTETLGEYRNLQVKKGMVK